MSDIKLFALGDQQATELAGKSAALEKQLQKQIEENMDVFLGVNFLATEYSTGRTHKGRIDSLGVDENRCPVIIEYKRHSNENVINQGLFYLDWLLDHQAEFKWLVMDKLGIEIAEAIEWASTRLICIATDFTRYDEHAVQKNDRNIELMRYRYFGDDLLLLELVNAQTAESGSGVRSTGAVTVVDGEPVQRKQGQDKTQAERLAEVNPELIALFEEVCAFTDQLGDEVQRKDLKLYTAFKRIRNFVSIVVLTPRKDPRLLVYLKLPGDFVEANGLCRDVSQVGHWGTGDLEVTIRTAEDLEKYKALIVQSYRLS